MDKYKKRLEEVKKTLDIMLTNLGIVLTQEYKTDISLTVVVGYMPGAMSLVITPRIGGKDVSVGDYSANEDLKVVKSWVRVSASWSDTDKANCAWNKINVYDEAIKGVFRHMLWGEDLMDLNHVITKWKEENGNIKME